MVMAKQGKKVQKQPTKAVMVDAIVNLETGLEQLYQKITTIDDALRQYINFKEDGDEFQKVLVEIYDARQKALNEQNEELAAKAAAEGEHSGEQSERNGGDTSSSSE